MQLRVYNSKKCCYEYQNVEPYSTMVQQTEDSVTDLHTWSPSLSSSEKLRLALKGSGSTPMYDFQDGVDNGSKAYLLRDKSLDVTERDAMLSAYQDELKESARKELNDGLEKINESIKASETAKTAEKSVQSDKSE